ncbi:type II toxin-antitoxin system HipA family toxin YjjJ [Luteolibacter arcticus]|uniref:Type II toxin-antitoxin system HipA family toxin YjjJ n=1 Tax=Luteolibacter arcticus TaxID=1581411 RepID=A0ABT3GNY6_9BACT|nr:type II toxin-antitoxin system HipA family toxin YjjJ [Luteolibacter arcticus]MCW1925240.1 type II toxin-antitoxin system HipA family toxin YjjJ [Luteolibacter arcticus]
MARPPRLPAKDLFSRLQTTGPVSAAELAADFRVDRSTITRTLGDFGSHVASFGATRRTRYALRRKVRETDTTFPLYQIDAAGRAERRGTVEAYHGAWRIQWEDTPPAWIGHFSDSEGLSDGLPGFVRELTPRGFLGGALATRLASGLQMSADPGRWSDDDLVVFLHAAGEEGPGDWILGDACLRRALALQMQPTPESTLAPHQAMTRYPELAARTMTEPMPGGWLGGEQPKFLATLEESGVERRQVLVKFSPPVSQGTGRRWADLLAMEWHALELLAEAGLAEKAQRLIDAGGRRFLELSRFDRTTNGGRRGTISLATLHGGHSGDWATRVADLERYGLCESPATERVRRLQAFGELIGNTDMHAGNLAFRMTDSLPFVLAPAYDMLPMLWAPGPQGELMDRAFAPQPPVPAAAEAWREMLLLAREFWSRVIADQRVSREFAATARMAGEVLTRLHERFG